jgi:hypothetical protein
MTFDAAVLSILAMVARHAYEAVDDWGEDGAEIKERARRAGVAYAAALEAIRDAPEITEDERVRQLQHASVVYHSIIDQNVFLGLASARNILGAVTHIVEAST